MIISEYYLKLVISFKIAGKQDIEALATSSGTLSTLNYQNQPVKKIEPVVMDSNGSLYPVNDDDSSDDSLNNSRKNSDCDMCYSMP